MRLILKRKMRAGLIISRRVYRGNNPQSKTRLANKVVHKKASVKAAKERIHRLDLGLS
jgi:hypothetical protein